MPTDTVIEHRYIAHGLATIRAANGMWGDINYELSRLSKTIRELLAGSGLSDIGRRDLTALLNEIDKAITASYSGIADAQNSALVNLMGIEDSFAQSASNLNRTAFSSAMESAISGLLVLGARSNDQWARLAGDLSFRIAAEVRGSAANGLEDSSIISRVIGVGSRGRERGGIMESAQRTARALVDTSVQSAVNSARMATFRANGVNAVKWHAILDPKVCPYCGVHDGKLYTLDGDPIGHDIELGIPPPAHWWCRCILLPMQYDNGPPEDGGPDKNSFAKWLDGLSQDQQENILGSGRADLYRRGVITLPDLINQNGRTMTLEELRAEAETHG